MSDRGKEVWLDTEGIADGEVFPEAIKRAIESSDAFVFVITPESVHSSYCEIEVEYAREMQKRIVPVLRERVPDSELPDEIRDRNWIPFTDDTGFDLSVERLVQALDTDLAAARAHTRWLVKALEWDGEGREKSLLLRGGELQAAEAWLAGSPEAADPAPSQLQREYLLASRNATARRQRVLLGISTGVAVVSIGLVIFALISRSQAVSERVSARSQALAAESQAQLANDPEISLILGMKALREKSSAQSMFALRAALDGSPLELGLPTIANPGSCGMNAGLSAAYSPNGKQIAEVSCTGLLEILDAATGRVLVSRQLATQGTALAYSPNGSILAVALRSGIALLSPRTGAMETNLSQGASAFAVAFSPNGRLIAGVGSNGVIIWRAPGWRPRTLVNTEVAGGNLVFSDGGRQLIVGGVHGFVHVYDVANGRLLHTIAEPGATTEDWPELVALSPNGRQLAVGYPTLDNNEDFVAITNTRTWARVSTVMSSAGVEISALAFSPNGDFLAVGAEDGTAGVWSVTAHEQLSAFDGPTAAVTSMQFAPGGRSVLTASNDGVARVWAAIGDERSFFTVPGTVGSVAVHDNRLEVMQQRRDGMWLTTLPLDFGHRLTSWRLGVVTLGTFSPDGRFLLTTGQYSQKGSAPIKIWNVDTRRVVKNLGTKPYQYFASSYDDSRWAVLAEGPSGPETSTILTPATGQTVTLVPSNPCQISGSENFAFSRNGQRIALGGFCGDADVWDTRTGHRVRQVNQKAEISAVDLSPDGSRLLVASWDSRATIWSVATGRPLVNLIGHTRGIVNAEFTAGGSEVVTSGLDHTVRVWNARTGQQLRVLSFTNDQYPLTVDSVGGQFALVEGSRMPGGATIVRVFNTCPACQDARELLKLAALHATNHLTTLESTVINAAGG